jgi:hypothetical protein
MQVLVYFSFLIQDVAQYFVCAFHQPIGARLIGCGYFMFDDQLLHQFFNDLIDELWSIV